MDEERMPYVGEIVLYRVGPGDTAELRNNWAEVLPAIVVQPWSPTCANLKVFTDGPTDVWVTSAVKGDEPSQWSYISHPLKGQVLEAQ